VFDSALDCSRFTKQLLYYGSLERHLSGERVNQGLSTRLPLIHREVPTIRGHFGVQSARMESYLYSFAPDFRYALRTHYHNRRFSLVAILALALGIGACTVVFSVVYKVFFHTLPYKDFNRSVVFEIRYVANAGGLKGRSYFSADECAFSLIGLVLVVIGVFSMMGYAVSLQTREIGIRLALGAQQGNILRRVLAEGLSMVTAGIFVGVIANYVLTRFLVSEIPGVSPTDPATFVVVVAIVVLAGVTACLLPARRASQTDPIVAIRYE
jgi:hypothetical protein